MKGKLKKLRFISALFLAAMLVNGCGEPQLKSGYEYVSDVRGVQFPMSTNIASAATAITNISDDMNFAKDQTYIYKDGKDSYLLFEMDTLVVAVEKGTHFNFDNQKDKEKALSENNILGIWFEKESKKLSYQEEKKQGEYSFTATVNAEVVISQSVYGDFTGKLSVCKVDGIEYAMFIGVPGTNYEKTQKGDREVIEYIADAFGDSTVTQSGKIDPVASEQADIAIAGREDLEKTDVEETVESDVATGLVERETIAETQQTPVEAGLHPVEITETEATAETVETVEVIDVAEETGSAEETGLAEETVPVQETEVILEVETEETKEESVVEETVETIPVEETVIEETVVEETATEEQETQSGTVESVPEVLGKTGLVQLNNQRSTARQKGIVYDSDIYDMLHEGESGYAEVFNPLTMDYSKVAVTGDRYYTGQDAVNIIKDACDNKLVPYTYFEPGPGLSWHVYTYSIDYLGVVPDASRNRLYLDTRFCGVDGNKLAYMGIKYDKRTYTIKYSDTEFAVFYAVPNGCKEYTLEFGDGTINNGHQSAYFYVGGF